MNRRNALKLSMGAGILGLLPTACQPEHQKSTVHNLPDIDTLTVLPASQFPEPMIISHIQLLKNGRDYIVRVRAENGAEGMAISNNAHMPYLYPILTKRIAPFFIGKDARELEMLIDRVYRTNSNYKYQGLPFWVPLASIEFALLDMLGKGVNKAVGALFGKIHNKEIAVYRANNYRGKSAEESVERIQQYQQESGAQAVKFKVGGRMNRNADNPPGRTEKLIPLVRQKLGDDITIYADSNGSYDVSNAIRIGKMLQEIGAGFFEEPCPFDHYEDTLQVAQALDIPIAGGEQDSSLWLMQWMIRNGALQIVQPDLFYFGGMVRSMKVARLAEAAGLQCVPHISGNGMGYLYMLHFVSALPNAGPYHEFKGINKDLPFDCPTSDLRTKAGVIKVPTGAGLGVELDAKFVSEAIVVEG